MTPVRIRRRLRCHRSLALRAARARRPDSVCFALAAAAAGARRCRYAGRGRRHRPARHDRPRAQPPRGAAGRPAPVPSRRVAALQRAVRLHQGRLGVARGARGRDVGTASRVPARRARESNSFFDKMYKVRNRIESFWDRDSLFSWRYFEDRHEGHFRRTTRSGSIRASARCATRTARPIRCPCTQDALGVLPRGSSAAAGWLGDV